MKRERFSLCVVAFGILCLTATTARAQTTAAGPYYVSPSWDQTLQCDTAATCPRFIVLSNFDGQAVLDRETGLVWQKSPSPNVVTWAFAHVNCMQLSVGHRGGWRLPTIQEQMSLLDTSIRGQVLHLPPGHPFVNVTTTDNLLYWSSTTLVQDPTAAWGMFFDDRPNVFGKTVQAHFWCVRGGSGIDAQ
jgi:hypothetical protein